MADPEAVRRARRAAMDKRYRKTYNYKRYLGIPTSTVPSAAAAEHVRCLLDLGWSAVALEQVCKGAVSSQTLLNLSREQFATISRTTEAAALGIPYTYAVPTQVRDEALVPARGAQRRLKALLAIGWSHRSLVDVTGQTYSFALARETATVINASRWREVASLYERLHMTPGPSERTASRVRGPGYGYVPPLAWDDIDDPAEFPTEWQYESPSREKFLRELADRGLGADEACRRLHLSRDALQKWCSNHGLRALYRQLAKVDALPWGNGNQWTRDDDQAVS